jgi:hypothetical protein
MNTFKLTLTLLLTTILTVNLFADGARNSLSVAPQKVYPKMIEAIETQDWEKLNNALKILQPLSQEIDKTLKMNITVELKQAIADRNSALIEQKVMEFIVGGVRSLLILSAKEDTPLMRKEMFRQAFTEFVTIEPFLKRINASITQQVMADFKGSYNSIQDKSQFITNAMIINKNLKTVVTKP